MEKENKYYTPGIEEFCVGFEYESRVAGYGAEWIKETIYAMFRDGWESNIDDVLAMYEDGGDEFRVKYLDQQDIEDCGFGLKRRLLNTKKIHYRGILFGNENYNIMLYLDNSIKITTSYGDTLFQGIIKNKTEFKKILKQIGVL